MGVLADIVATTAPTMRIVPLVPGTVTPLCQPAAGRYAIGFQVPFTGYANISIAPGEPSGMGVKVMDAPPIWFNVKDHGSFAQAEWYDLGTGTAVFITVLELIFNSE